MYTDLGYNTSRDCSVDAHEAKVSEKEKACEDKTDAVVPEKNYFEVASTVTTRLRAVWGQDRSKYPWPLPLDVRRNITEMCYGLLLSAMALHSKDGFESLTGSFSVTLGKNRSRSKRSAE